MLRPVTLVKDVPSRRDADVVECSTFASSKHLLPEITNDGNCPST